MKNESLRSKFAITEENIAQRRALVRLGSREKTLIESLIPWAESVASRLSEQFYDWQFEVSASRRFLERMAKKKGIPVTALRSGLEKAQAQYWCEAFQGARNNWDLAYFEKRLHIGVVHNIIDLPFKLYLGYYSEYLRLARIHLREKYDAEFTLDAIEVLQKIFNLDMQAVGDAYTLSLLESAGVGLHAIQCGPDEDRADHLGEAKRVLSETVQEVLRLAPNLAGASGTLTQVSTQLAESADSTTSEVKGVADSATVVSDSMEKLSIATQQMGEAVEEIARSAANAAQFADDSVVQSQRAKTLLDKLAVSGQEIGKVTRLITGIADQTNLLALNATITAARAGSAGRGFGVVASEVKELSKGTATAADEISTMVSSVQADVNAAGGVLSEIMQLIEKISLQQTSVAGAVQEQSATTHEIGKSVSGAAAASADIVTNLNRVAQATQDTRTAAERTGTSASELDEMARKLNQTVAALRHGP